MRTRIVVATSFAVVLLVAGAILLAGRPGTGEDPDFDTTVADPAYRGGGPVVLFDEGHRNTHTSDGGYKPLVELLRHDGYEVRVARGALTAEALAGANLLLVVLPRGANDANDGPAFTASEVDAVDGWVRAGGSLLLVTDHWPYGAAAASLGERFGVRMGTGLVEDPAQHDPERGTSHLVFSAENALLRDHAIVRGRSADEGVRRVLTFTGQSLLGPPDAVPFLALSDSATERPPTPPRVDKRGGDVRVEMEYGDPVPARGRAQGVAFETERGRVVVLGEAGMLRAERGRDGARVGMNVAGYDNRQLALNIAHWLTRLSSP